jgi:hypothetical protein
MPPQKGLKVVILHTATEWGLGQDAQLVEQILRESNSCGHMRIDSIQHIDPLQFYCGPVRPTMVDIAIHLEVPCRAAAPWAAQNIVVVNQEWWPSEAWNWAIQDKTFLFVFKTKHARSLFPEVEGKRCRVIPWRSGADIGRVVGNASNMKREFLYLIGASQHKLAAAKRIVASWDVTLPQLTIVGTESVIAQLKESAGTGIVFQTTVEHKEKLELQTRYGYHIVGSVAEGFGFSFAEAAVCGALPLWTAIPVYDELWGSVVGDIGRIECSIGKPNEWRDTKDVSFSHEAVRRAVHSILDLDEESETRLRGALKHAASVNVRDFRVGWRNLLGSLAHKGFKNVTVPPPRVTDPPHVAIITLTHNRSGWWGNMVQNILMTEYPRDKMTWVIADDSSGPERVDSHVQKFQSTHPEFHVRYVSLGKKLPIGEKRNRACTAAPAECSVFLMMDDDDHYPSTSVATRVAWLQGRECVYCSTLPMYDIPRYISAVNVPPLILSPEERVSEATLCFTRAFWESHKFPNPVNIAEGEAFLSGRTEKTAEIPPNGVIVSFIHKGNTTSRRVPTETEANGSHYGFSDEYFSYLCSVGGAGE